MMLNLSDQAKKKIAELLKEKNDPSYFFRVGVKGGGCSGMSYTVNVDNQLNEKDHSFGEGLERVVCDPKSYLYIIGANIDFNTDLVGGGFQFKNPNAEGSCGCGTSFSV